MGRGRWHRPPGRVALRSGYPSGEGSCGKADPGAQPCPFEAAPVPPRAPPPASCLWVACSGVSPTGSSTEHHVFRVQPDSPRAGDPSCSFPHPPVDSRGVPTLAAVAGALDGRTQVFDTGFGSRKCDSTPSVPVAVTPEALVRFLFRARAPDVPSEGAPPRGGRWRSRAPAVCLRGPLPLRRPSSWATSAPPTPSAPPGLVVDPVAPWTDAGPADSAPGTLRPPQGLSGAPSVGVGGPRGPRGKGRPALLWPLSRKAVGVCPSCAPAASESAPSACGHMLREGASSCTRPCLPPCAWVPCFRACLSKLWTLT